MSLSLTWLRSSNALFCSRCPPKHESLNLIRKYSSSNGVLLFRQKNLQISASQALSRYYHKQKVEVEKRIQWERPKRTSSVLPEHSGDLSKLPELDLDEPPPLFKESEEYQKADDLVKRVLSLRFQPRDTRREAKVASLTQIVKRHAYDKNSVEVKIAKYTAIIRNIHHHHATYPYDKNAKADLKEIIDFRKKRLKLLRSLDYKRFEWLLEKLDIIYKPAPRDHARIERKKSLRWLTEEYIEKTKREKLEGYKTILDSQKRGFLERKLSTMKAIVEEEKAVGVEPSFTAEDIAEVEEALRQRIAEDERTHPVVEEVKEVY